MTNWLKAHFQRYREREPWDFCWRITLEGTLVSLAAAVGLVFLGAAGREMELEFGTLVFVCVVVAPVVETLVFQAFPVWIARLCEASFPAQIVASVVPFFIAHAIEGIAVGIAAGLIGGFYFAFTYAHWRQKRRWTAFWVTTVSHAIHNAIAIALALALGEI